MANKNEKVVFEHHIPEKSDLQFGTGAAWFDCDGDGDLDLYITQRVGANALYRNNRIGLGSSDFTEITSGDAFDASHDGAGVSAADYDNDGDIDLYLANSDEDVLLSNDGSGVFQDVTRESFPQFPSFMPGRGTTASWGDINNDGWLDLYISNHFGVYVDSNIPVQDFLLLNNGGNPVTFSNITVELAGDHDLDGTSDVNGLSFGALFTDINNDGLLDIYVSNDCPFGLEDNKLWLNEGNFQFKEISDLIGPNMGGKSKANGSPKADCQNAMGMAAGDVNRDGYTDYFHTNLNDEVNGAIYITNNKGFFIDHTLETGLLDLKVAQTGLPRITWGTVLFDFNNDMLLDLAVAAGTLTGTVEATSSFQPNLLYQNTGIDAGIAQFSKVEDDLSGFGDLGKGRTLIKGDYDLDGDLDLFLVNYNGTAILYENQNPNQYNWVIIDLVGSGAPLSNLNGIGAKISVSTEDGITQHHEVRSGSSLGGGDDLGAYFGLGTNTSVDIKVKWPSGLETVHNDIESNQRLKLYEVEPVILGFNSFDITNEMVTYPNPFLSELSIDFELNETLYVSLSLFNMNGQLIRNVIVNQRLAAGKHMIDWDGSNLIAGVYFLRFTTDNSVWTKKVMKQ